MRHTNTRPLLQQMIWGYIEHRIKRLTGQPTDLIDDKKQPSDCIYRPKQV
jgi:hypothetical protein